jgi:DNA-binding transcriptional regulator YdaS (Cro superfamily)
VTKYKAHPAAELFPMMDAEQYEAFKEDIRKNGFQQDVVIYQGRILDGRNRYKAAIELDMLDDLPIAEMDDDTDIDPYQWVVSRNLHRRHLTESQRAMVAQKLATLKRGGDRSKASIDALKQDDAAKLLNVSPASLDRAKTVQRKGSPELIAAVEQGEIRVSRAATIAKTVPKERQLDEAKKPTTSTTVCSDDNQGWLPDEIDRKRQTESGRAVVAQAKRDGRLVTWAYAKGLAVFVDRRGPFGNPFKIGKDGDRDEVCDKFEKWIGDQSKILGRVDELRGKVLVCHCYPERCHGMTLAKLANGEPITAKTSTTSTTSASGSMLDEPADISAEIGSRPWARGVANKIRFQADNFDSVVRSLQGWIEIAAEHEAWRPLGYVLLDALLIKEAGISQDVIDAVRQAWPQNAAREAAKRNR